MRTKVSKTIPSSSHVVFHVSDIRSRYACKSVSPDFSIACTFFLAILVNSGRKQRSISSRSVISSQNISRNRSVCRADVWLVVDVVDWSGYKKLFIIMSLRGRCATWAILFSDFPAQQRLQTPLFAMTLLVDL